MYSIQLKRIVHLEDDAAQAELSSYELRREWPNCQIDVVSTEADFVAALQGTAVDVVLSDFALGGFDGMRALELLRKYRANVPFILFSGTIGEEKAVAALKAGATDYVLKDRPARLIPAIRRALMDARTAETRRELEQRFQQLAEISNDVFWFADLNPFRIRYISPGVRMIWELEPEAFYSDPFAGLSRLHVEDRARVAENFNGWLAGERISFREEYRVVRPDGTQRWVLDEGAFAIGADGTKRISGVARDITQAKETFEQSLRTQRLESIGLLAGGIAHDLNNALAPVLMGLEMLRPEIDPRGQALFDQMLLSTRRGTSMVRQLLGFARGAEGRRSVVDPRRALREVTELAASTFPKEVTVVAKLERQVPNVHVEPTLLHQVLLNLCVNARDAMPHGGTLTAEVDLVVVDESYAAFVEHAKPGRYVVFTISDTGVGISSELMKKIFDPFFTTKPQGVGTGLGLTTVAGIAHNHGGFVRVYSEICKGSCFKVHLPTVEGNVTPPKPSVTATYDAHGAGALVADDEETVRVLLKGLLERFGFCVHLSANGAEALAKFAHHRDEIKLVLTDERMPHLDGLAFIRALRHLAPTIPVIAMSGLHNEARLRDFAALKVTHVLHKPFAIDELIDAIRDCLDAPLAQPEMELG